jgi:hypothetical protein
LAVRRIFDETRYTISMKLSRLIYTIAVIIIGVWVIGLLFKLAAWLISSLLYIAAIIVILGLVRNWWENRKKNNIKK